MCEGNMGICSCVYEIIKSPFFFKKRLHPERVPLWIPKTLWHSGSRARFWPNSVAAKTVAVLLWPLHIATWLTQFCRSQMISNNTQQGSMPSTHWPEGQILTHFCSDQNWSNYTCVRNNSVMVRSLMRQDWRWPAIRSDCILRSFVTKNK